MTEPLYFEKEHSLAEAEPDRRIPLPLRRIFLTLGILSISFGLFVRIQSHFGNPRLEDPVSTMLQAVSYLFGWCSLLMAFLLTERGCRGEVFGCGGLILLVLVLAFLAITSAPN